MSENLTYNYPWDYDYDGDSGTGMINPPPFPGGGGVDEDEMNAAIKTAVDKLVGGAPEALDTLGELADALEGDESIVSAVMNQLINKVDKDTYEADKETFALKSEIPTVPENLSEFNNDVGFVTETALEGYALKEDIPTKVSQLENDANYLTEHQSLEEYAKKEDVYTKEETDGLLDAKLDKSTYDTDKENFALVENIPTKVSELTNDAEYLNTEEVNNIIDGKIEDMATETWVEEQNYLTEHQSLEEYAKKADLATVATSGSYNDLIDKPVIPVVPTDVSAFTNDAGYLTEHQDLSSYFNGAVYDSTEKKIFFKHDNTVIAEIDATSFIKDGMVNNVVIDNGNLVITFNEEAGKQSISIPLTEIFNPDNYYTKNETDGLLDTKANEADLATVAKTGSYNDLANTPVIPVVPTNVSAFTNDAGYLTEHQSLEEYATKEEMNSGDDSVLTNILGRIWSNTNKEKTGYFQTKYTNADGSYAMIWNESDGGGSLYENKTDGIKTYVGVNADGRNGICAQIYSKDVSTNTGSRLNINPNGMFYGVGNSASTEAGKELAVKGDIAADRAEVDAIIAEKDATIAKLTSDLYELKKAVGNIGGAVTYELPGPEGKTFSTLMGNTGTVKLTDNVESGRYGPGMMASNKTTLNLNNHDLTITGLTESSSQAGIMARGTQEITITGKGTIDSGAGICVEANGADCVINLIGSTTVYHNNRPGGELIYCYNGTINITNGTFRNDGASNYTLNCYDANYTAGTAKIIVSSTSKTTGPKFYDFNPGDNLSEGEHTNYVAEGCHVISNVVVEDEVEHTVYTVVKDA